MANPYENTEDTDQAVATTESHQTMSGQADLLYTRFKGLGYTRCASCVDYVDPTTHDCARYAALVWLGAHSTPTAEVRP